ncbi:MAG: universal stress protein [Candidatus Nanohaloarchaea archaeon]|nr:universal stress protein [Candidatus Nanohaloarchaea archaeon]
MTAELYDNILIPTDGSSGTEKAVEHALDLAETYDATIHVLYVIDMHPSYHGVLSENYIDELKDEGEKAIDDVVEKATGRGRKVTTKIARGIPHKVILRYAEENDIDLIAMGTHGRTGIRHLALGSVAEKVIRAADIPVLTARMTPEDG